MAKSFDQLPPHPAALNHFDEFTFESARHVLLS